jgi:hypothetical protein
MRVQCPKCKRKNTYTTTDKYNPDIVPHGGMVTLRNPRHKGGMTFGTVKGTSSIGAAFMECCDCGGMLVQGNRLIVLPEELPLPVDPVRARNQAVIDAAFKFDDVSDLTIYAAAIGNEKTAIAAKIEDGKAVDVVRVDKLPPLTCPHCGKECKSLAGLTSHIRNSHGDK